MNWRTQLGIAYALMTVIPLLTFAYFLASYVLPSVVTRESLIVVMTCNIILSLAGFAVIAGTIRALDLSGNLENEVAKRTEELNSDIRERKKVEQALRESNMMLSDALCELKEMERRLIQEERMSALGQMASSIAHDFNNALMPISGLSEFLLMNPDKLDDKQELISTLKDIHASADRAREAVLRLREFYNSDETADFELIDVNKVFEKALALCEPKLEKTAGKGAIEIRRECGEVPLIHGNETDLREAVKSVVVNSIEAMPQGGTIDCRSYLEGKYIVMEVADTGIGMTPDVHRRCIDPFFSTKQGHGIGIGLSVAYGIVRRHRGNLEIRSEPGKGTKVRIILPQVKVPEAGAADKPGEPGDVGHIRILVVDDDFWARTVLCRYLQGVGHTVETADTGSKGVEAFRSGQFDFVITDKAMPDMSGEQVASFIGKSGKKVPVIMLTGFGEIMKDKGEMPEGVSRVMSKPVSMKELKKAICEIYAAKKQ